MHQPLQRCRYKSHHASTAGRNKVQQSQRSSHIHGQNRGSSKQVHAAEKAASLAQEAGNPDAVPDQQMLEMLDFTVKYLKQNKMDGQVLACLEQVFLLRRRLFGSSDAGVRDTLVDLVHAYNSAATGLMEKCKYAECLRLLEKALSITRLDASHNQHLQILIYNNIGCSYRKWGKIKAALRYFNEAAHLGALCFQSKHMSITYFNLCAIHSQLGKHVKALEFAQATIFYIQDETVGSEGADAGTTSDPKLNEQNMLALAVAYYNFAVELEYNKRGAVCVQYYQKSLSIAEDFKVSNQKLYKSLQTAFIHAKKQYRNDVRYQTGRLPHRPIFERRRPQSACIQKSGVKERLDAELELSRPPITPLEKCVEQDTSSDMWAEASDSNRQGQVKAACKRPASARPRCTPVRAPNCTFQPDLPSTSEKLIQRWIDVAEELDKSNVVRTTSTTARGKKAQLRRACSAQSPKDLRRKLYARPLPSVGSFSHGISDDEFKSTTQRNVRHHQILRDSRSLSSQWSDEELENLLTAGDHVTKLSFESSAASQSEISDKGERVADSKQRSCHMTYLQRMKDMAQSIRDDLIDDTISYDQTLSKIKEMAQQIPLNSTRSSDAHVSVQRMHTHQLSGDVNALTYRSGLNLQNTAPLRNGDRVIDSVEYITSPADHRSIDNAHIWLHQENSKSGKIAEMKRIKREQLSASIIEDRIYEFMQHRKRLTIQVREDAAVRMQSFWRGVMGRNAASQAYAKILSRSYVEQQHLHLELEIAESKAKHGLRESAACSIQNMVRVYQRRLIQEAIHVERHMAATRIQQRMLQYLHERQTIMNIGVAAIAARLIQEKFVIWKAEKNAFLGTQISTETDDVREIAVITLQRFWHSILEKRGKMKPQ